MATVMMMMMEEMEVVVGVEKVRARMTMAGGGVAMKVCDEGEEEVAPTRPSCTLRSHTCRLRDPRRIPCIPPSEATIGPRTSLVLGTSARRA